MSRTSRRRRALDARGFSLVGLVVTLSIVVTLSGVAAIFYDNVVQDQQLSIAANELDEYSKAVRAYMLTTKRNLDPAKLTPIDASLDGTPGGYSLDFLVEAGYYPEINRDPWLHFYRLDAANGNVYSLGPDPSDASDDIRRSYSRSTAKLGLTDYDDDVILRDELPPVISGIQPVGVIKVNDPTVRATFYDHFGGTIDQSSVRLYFDALDMVAHPGLTTDSAGQVLFTTGEYLEEGKHTVVVQVADEAGNLARREWDFVVDTLPAVARIREPVQGSAIKGSFSPEFEASDDNLEKVTIRLDFGNESGNANWQGTAESDGIWNGAPVPQSNPSNGRKFVGRWTNRDTTAAAPEGIPDGTHFFTVLVEDGSGRVISDQSQFLVDNTPPTIEFSLPVDPLSQPPTSPTSPQIISTSIIHLEARATDNLQVAKVWFEFTRESDSSTAGRRGSVVVTGPELLVPVDYRGVPVGDWGALFNSVEEIASTTAQSVPSYIPVTLTEDTYYLNVWAEDLASNISSTVSTKFVVNLSASGLVGLALVDFPYTQTSVGPINKATRTLSAMDSARYNNWTDPSMGGSAQTTGHLTYQLLRFEPSSTIEAMIDDQYIAVGAGSDGVYHTDTPGFPQDWFATESLPLTTGQHPVHMNYIPYGDNEGMNVGTRRSPAVGEMPGGEYEARVTIDFLTSEDRIAYTTFYLDTEYPLYQDKNTLQVEGPPAIFTPLEDLATPMEVGALTLTSPPAVLFGGKLIDELCNLSAGCDQNEALVTQVWARRYSAKDGAPPPITSVADWELVFPIGGSVPKVEAVYGALANQAGSGPFRLTSPTQAALEGEHYLDLKAVDAGGHTTAWRKTILVNTLGPVIQGVTIENTDTGPQTFDLATGVGALSTIEDSFLELTVTASDEVLIDRLEYRILPKDGSSTLGSTVIPIIPGGVSPYTHPTFQVYQDQLGSAFQTAPTSYLLEVFAVGAGRSGPIFTTSVQFTSIGDIAIYAPNYSSGSKVIGMGPAEQKAIADYLVNNLETAENVAIYDLTGNLVAEKPGGSNDANISNWINNHKNNSEQDVLVVLDAFWEGGFDDSDSSPIEDYLDAGEPNVLVFSGGANPGLLVHESTGDLDTTPFFGWGGGNDASRGVWFRLFDQSWNCDHAVHADRVRMGENVQVPTAKAKMLLPSLGTYRPQDLWPRGIADFGVLQGPRDFWTGNNWVVEERFLEDTKGGNDDGIWRHDRTGDAHDNEDSGLREGAAMVLRRTSSDARFAFFYSHGDQELGYSGGSMSGAQARSPVAAAGPVIEEFLERYLGGEADPDGLGGKVAFTARSQGLDLTRVEKPDGASPGGSEIDALLWPLFEGSTEKFLAFTPTVSADGNFNAANKHEAVAVLDTDASGSLFLVLSEGQDAGEITNFGDFAGVYLMRADGDRKPVYSNKLDVGNANASWGRLSSDGRMAVVVGAENQDGVFGTYASPVDQSPVVWLVDVRGSPVSATRISGNEDGMGTTGATRADISASGDAVVFLSDTPHEGTGLGVVGSRLAKADAVMGQALVVYDVGADTYYWVNKPDPSVSVAPDLHSCGSGIDFFKYVNPVEAAISANGDSVVWIGEPSNTPPADCLGNQRQLLLSRRVAGTWYTGKLTNCPSGTDCEIGADLVSLDMAEVGADFPRVVFSTKGNFRGAKIGGSGGSSANSAPGADPGGGSGGSVGPSGGAPDIFDDFEYVETPVASDDFTSNDYGGGPGWTGGWGESNDDASAVSGEIKVVTGVGGCNAGSARLRFRDVGGAAPCGGLVCDDFNSGDYSGGFGWATASWDEYGDDGQYWSGNVYRTGADGGSACDNSTHIHSDPGWWDFDGIMREVDLSGWTSPRIRVSMDSSNLEGGENTRISYYYGGSWTVASTDGAQGCGVLDRSIPVSGYVTIYIGSNADQWGADLLEYDNVILYDGALPGPAPEIERQFPTLAVPGLLRFTREIVGLGTAEKGIGLEYYDGSWHTLRDWSAVSPAERNCQQEAFPLPAGTERIRFKGTGFNNASDGMEVDDLEIATADPYGVNLGQWLGRWTESNDGANSPFEGQIRAGGAYDCMPNNNLVLEPNPGAIGAPGVRVERGLDLSGFKYPFLSFKRYFAPNAFAPSGEKVFFEFSDDGGASWSTLRDYSSLGAGDHGLCVEDKFFLNSSAANAKIRFRIEGGNYDAGEDIMIVDDILIHDAASDCPDGAPICEDFNGVNYNSGFGWSGNWTELKDTGGGDNPNTGDVQISTVSLGTDCDDGGHVEVTGGGTSPGSDSTKAGIRRTFDPVVMGTMANPVLEFDLTFTCGSCDEGVEPHVYHNGTWKFLGDIHANAVLPCQRYSMAMPPGSEHLALRGLRGPAFEGDETWKIDNIVVRDAPEKQNKFVCQPGNICEDWSTDSYDGGQGWGGNDWGSDTSKTSIQNSSTNPCRDGYHLRLDDDFDNGKKIDRDFPSITPEASLRYRVGFWAEGDADSGETARVEVESTDGTVRGIDVRGEDGCEFYEFALQDGDAPKFIKIEATESDPESNEYFYLDNMVIWDAAATVSGGCPVGDICDDFSSENDSGGVGWSGSWGGDAGGRVTYENGSTPNCQDGGFMQFEDLDAKWHGRNLDMTVMNAISDPVIEFDWAWTNVDNADGDYLNFRVRDTFGTYTSTLVRLNSGDSCGHILLSLDPSSTGLAGTVDRIQFQSWGAGDSWNGNDRVAIDNIHIHSASTTTSGPLHDQRGIYLWTGAFGTSGEQFVHLANPKDAPAMNPRVSPDGRTYVFETDADEIVGLFSWDPTESNPETRRVEQVINVNDGGARSGTWSDSRPRKVFRGRINSSTNTSMGGSAVLQLIAPLDDVGTTGTDLRPVPSLAGWVNPFENYTHPVCGN